MSVFFDHFGRFSLFLGRELIDGCVNALDGFKLVYGTYLHDDLGVVYVEQLGAPGVAHGVGIIRKAIAECGDVVYFVFIRPERYLLRLDPIHQIFTF